MANEVELKLTAGPAFSEEALVERLRARGRLGDDRRREQVDVYFDTEDAELARAGLSARTRHKDGKLAIEVKPVPIEAGLVMQRAESIAKVDPEQDPTEVLCGLLEALGLPVGGRPTARAELRTLRRTLDYTEPGLRAELCIDRVRVHRPGDAEPTAGFVEVELELAEGDPALLETVAAEIRGLELEPSGRSKYVRAREILGLAPYRYGPARPDCRPSTPVDALVRAVCRHQLETMLAYAPGTRVGLDTEHLHKMRVASRRLRTALRVFRKFLPRDEARDLRAELKWLGAQLGEVRDLDVHALALPSLRRTFGGEPVAGWAALEARLTEHRDLARAALLEALDSPRFGALVAAGRRLCAAPPGRDEPVSDHAGSILAKHVRHFQRGVERFEATHAAEDAHRLRILGKRLRYTAEFLRDVVDEPVRAAIKRLSAFQDALGAVQDAVAAGAFARRVWSAQPSDPALIFVLGQVVGWSAAVEANARPHVDEALAELDVRPLAAAVDEMTGG